MEFLCETIDLKGGRLCGPRRSPLESSFLATGLKGEKPRSLVRFIRGEPELRPIAGVRAGGGVM